MIRIRVRHSVTIEAAPITVYQHIADKEVKFPVYSFLDSRLFLAFRLIAIGEPKAGFRLLLRGRAYKSNGLRGKLNVGDFYGPFQLMEASEAEKYLFRLKTKLGLFDLKAGYLLDQYGADTTTLSLIILSESANFLQRWYWRLVKPVHGLLARKVLNSIKKEVEALNS